MEFGGVSVPGRNARADGAYLFKDLSAFEAQLGGLSAFVMASDSTGDGAGSQLAAQLAVKAADSHLGSVLRGIATGQHPVVEPAALLDAIVSAANRAVLDEAAAVGGTDVTATFVGALVSPDRVWFGRIGPGSLHRLRDEQSRELVPEPRPAEKPAPVAVPVVPEVASAAPAIAPDLETAVPEVVSAGEEPIAAYSDSAAADASAAVTQVLPLVPEPAAPVPAPVPLASPTLLGQEGVRADLGSADLVDGDVLVLLGSQASEALGDADVRGITCAACDARVAAADLAAVAARTDPARSVTLAVWSTDSSLFTPVPEPELEYEYGSHAAAAEYAVLAVNDDVSGGWRAERIFLWVMTGLIVAEVLALGGMAVYSKLSSTSGRAASKPTPSVAETTATEPPVEPATVATAAPEPAPAQPPATPAEQPEYPKTLKVPSNVKGGLWLRKKANTTSGSNLVIQLRAGAKVKASDIQEFEDAKGKKQEFYVFNVSDLEADQVVETSDHPWPPSGSIETVYAFAKSFEPVD